MSEVFWPLIAQYLQEYPPPFSGEIEASSNGRYVPCVATTAKASPGSVRDKGATDKAVTDTALNDRASTDKSSTGRDSTGKASTDEVAAHVVEGGAGLEGGVEAGEDQSGVGDEDGEDGDDVVNVW